MPAAKEPVEVFEIDSSDDEGRAAVSRSREVPLRGLALPSTSGSQAVLTDSDYAKQKLGCRSFWQAGNFEIGPSKSASLKGELEHARVHPKFLHSNATSHKWAFGAIAELLDNSVDEICHGATSVKVDKILNAKDNSPALLFQDDGGGMDPDGIRKCMSLGYSSKKTNTTIGQYGNGFKTSTMRLGADVIVFSRSTRSGQATQSVGLLSYTFLRLTGQDDVIVPMVDFDISNNWAEPIICGSQEDWSTNLNTILEWSPFPSKEDLMKQFESIGSHGTRIIIYNLWLNDEGIYELNFDDDDEDIELRDEATRGSASKLSKKAVELRSHISYRMRYSLRAYASILYMRKLKNFKIVLRGKPVEQFDIEDELIYPQLVTYKPQIAAISEEVSMKTTLGFIKQAPELNVSGFNVYHKNRLIRPFWKVTRDGSSVGNGVVGVLEANFIEPAHDKQDFERSALFIRLEARLKQMVLDYWRTHCHLIGYQSRMSNVQPPAKIQKQSHIVQAVMERPTASVQKHLQPAQPSIGGAAASRMTVTSVQLHSGGEKYQKDSSTVQPVVDPTADSRQEIPPVDGSTAISVDQICEENIQLFMRCEGSVRKQNELKQTINKLEKELEETRNKCAQLAAYIEGRKTQNLLLHQTGQV